MRAVLNISFSLSKVPQDKIIVKATGMSTAALPFSFGYECQEHLWFDSQTTSTITFVPFGNILHIFTGWKQITHLLKKASGSFYATFFKMNRKRYLNTSKLLTSFKLIYSILQAILKNFLNKNLKLFNLLISPFKLYTVFCCNRFITAVSNDLMSY